MEERHERSVDRRQNRKHTILYRLATPTTDRYLFPAVVNRPGQLTFQVLPADDAVDEAVLQEEFAGLEVSAVRQAIYSILSASIYSPIFPDNGSIIPGTPTVFKPDLYVLLAHKPPRIVPNFVPISCQRLLLGNGRCSAPTACRCGQDPRIGKQRLGDRFLKYRAHLYFASCCGSAWPVPDRSAVVKTSADGSVGFDFRNLLMSCIVV